MNLADIPGKYASPDPSTLAKLPKPTSKDNPKGKCPVCDGWHGLPAIHIDYQGHAEITLALIEIDPDWNWAPVAVDPTTGAPVIVSQGNRLVMWAHLTVLGKTMPGVGTCEANKPDPEKELIGDFLRNAAMRFGIATKLWSKADSADPAGSGQGGGYTPAKTTTTRRAAPRDTQEPTGTPQPPAPPQAATRPQELASDAQVKLLAIQCKKAGIEETDRILFVSNLVGRTITSTRELTRPEISKAIDEMQSQAS